jgi:ATP-dependent DNA ligase
MPLRRAAIASAQMPFRTLSVHRTRSHTSARNLTSSSPPAGEAWLHEVKLDGYRVQLHKHARAATIYSKNGADFTRRFPAIAVLALPVSSCSSTASSWRLALPASPTSARCSTGGRAAHACMPSI